MISREELKQLRKQYPSGTLIRLIHMDDIQAPPDGTLGRVDHVDDTGTIFVNWANGSGLGLIIGEDQFEIANR